MKSESSSIPFSISPDAVEYLCQRLIGMPPEARVNLMLATRQTDGQNPPRWFYGGQSFIFGYREDGEKTQAEFVEYEIMGRSVAIEASALKQLSGRTLALRRVGSTRGLLNIHRYILVADSAPGVSGSRFCVGSSPEDVKRKLSIAAFTILGGFTGLGAIWFLAVAFVFLLRIPYEKLLPLASPAFVLGWITGAIISFYYSRFVFKTSGRTLLGQEQIQKKYVGYGGLDFDLGLWIFLGIPIPPTLILIFAVWPHVRTPGEKAGVVFAAIMLVFVPCMYFCDRLPRRWIFYAGIIGWLLTISLGFWYYKTHGL